LEQYDLEEASDFSLAESMTDGSADYRYFLWVPERSEDADEKDYLVIFNKGDRRNKELEIVYQFKAEYILKKCRFAISNDGKTVVVGYTAKKGVICYDCESGKALWNNTKIKKIDRIRFNNFDANIIEVLNDKLEFTYLDKQTGAVLEPERAKKVRQVINYMRVSKNGKYLMTADGLSSKDKANYTVYDTDTKEIKGRFAAQSNVGEYNFDITNDGELAVCAAYQREGISLIKVSTGEVLWTQKRSSRISRVYIDKTEEKVVVCCQYGGIDLLNIQTGKTKTHIQGEEMHLNTYGDDILFPEDKFAQIGGKLIECPSFSWLRVVGIRGGVLLQPAGQYGLQLYDNNGNLLWKNDELRGKAAYQEDTDLIVAFSTEDYVGKITIASARDGQILATKEIPKYPCAFIHNNKTVVCNTGKMYDISKGLIQEIEEPFEFVVGR